MIDTLLMAVGYVFLLIFGTTILHWLFPRSSRRYPRLRRPYVTYHPSRHEKDKP